MKHLVLLAALLLAAPAFAQSNSNGVPISQLPPSGTITGNEILPMVQSGTTVKSSLFSLYTPYNSVVATLTNKTLVSAIINTATLNGIIAGGPTYSGVPIYSGLSTGTQVSCVGLDSGNHLVLSVAGCGLGVNDCVGNSSSSSVLYNQAGICKGLAAFTFDNTNKATLNDTGTAPPSVIGGGRLVVEGTQGASATIDAGPKVVINGFTSGSFGGEPSVGYAASSGTPASPTALSDALVASPVLAYAYNGTDYQGAQGAVARIDVWNDTASGTFSGSDMGTGICFGTTGRGSTSILLDSLCVDDNRGVVLRGNLYTGTPQGDGTLNSAGLYHKNLPFRLDAITNTDITAVTESYTNNGATGTNAGKIAKLSAGQVGTVGTGDTLDGIGICVALSGYTCGTTGKAAIAYAGQPSCFFDGSTTAGHWVIVSTSVAGDCSDGGASIPAGVEILGTVVTTNSGAGLYKVDLNPVGMTAVVVAHGGGGGGGAPATCALAGNYACRNLAASWSASQRGTNATITETAGTATPDWSAGNNQIFQLVHADCPCTLANPTNIVQGQTGVITIQQSASGSDTIITWGGDWIFLTGVNPTLSTTASAKDYFSYYVDTSTRIIIVQVSSETAALNLANIFTAQQTVNFNTAAAPTPPTGTGFFANGADSTAIRNTVSGFANPSFFTSLRADGTGASPTAVQSGDQIGGYNAYAYNGSAYIGPLASFRTYAAENQSSGHGGTKGCIATTPTASTTLADVLCVTNDGQVQINGGSNIAHGELIGVQRITATGAYTYTPTTGTNSVVVEVLGAGGGGGGIASPTGSNVGVGTGGSAGAWCRVRLTANFSGATGSVGAHGTGGAAGANAGVTGGNTTFISTVPTTYTAGGGTGGEVRGTGASPSLGTFEAGGTCTNGDDQVPGGASVFGLSLSTSLTWSGSGGNSKYGQGGAAQFAGANGSSAGQATAGGKGAGGSGAAVNGTGIAAKGGDAGDGEVIIWEYN